MGGGFGGAKRSRAGATPPSVATSCRRSDEETELLPCFFFKRVVPSLPRVKSAWSRVGADL